MKMKFCPRTSRTARPRVISSSARCALSSAPRRVGRRDRQGPCGASIVVSGSPIANYLIDNSPKTPGEELVVLSHLFIKHPSATGYSPTTFSVVKSVNGQPVASLRQLAKALTESKDEYLTIAFHDKDAETLVFKREEMAKATLHTQKNEGIFVGLQP